MPFEAVRGSDFDGSPVNIAQTRDAAGLLYRGSDIFSPDVLPITPVQLAATGTGLIIPAVTGRRIRILSLILSAGLGGDVRLVSGSTIAAGRIYLATNQTIVVTSVNGIFETVAGESFSLNLTTINNLGVYGNYRLI